MKKQIRVKRSKCKANDNKYRLHQVRKVPKNCIAFYREEERLSFNELSIILGSGNCCTVKTICASKHPSAKHIRILALHEGLTVPEFLLRYAPAGKDAA